MPGRRHTEAGCTESAANSRINAFENESGLNITPKQGYNHDRKGGLSKGEHTLRSGPELPASERHRREAAVRFARISIGLEGFVPSRSAELDAQRFIEGQIELSEFVGSR